MRMMGAVGRVVQLDNINRSAKADGDPSCGPTSAISAQNTKTGGGRSCDPTQPHTQVSLALPWIDYIGVSGRGGGRKLGAGRLPANAESINCPMGWVGGFV